MSKITLPPAICVKPGLCEVAEKVLTNNGTQASFVKKAIRSQVQNQQIKVEFLQRALTSRDNAAQTGIYTSTDVVHNKLREILRIAKINSVI
ncbi:hypothetical protein CUZ56_00589 [Saezia sanguinis]|uniref:Uncharacterized protein n=1 Tax=Saezia sanguinis TaxID=1965230 RepID=A0A433SHG1_9BURK|nr:prevent-host-death protein [Saezia sanguinis]RUS68104.1 hypothetical protein CUZ56_00589 [Saezia sanguinis]